MAYFAITVAHNETFFLPKWVRYYGAQLGLENLFVVDHGSTDGSVASLPPQVNVIRVPRTNHNDGQRARFVSQFHAALLQYYDGGFVTDCDEFLVADPRHHASLAALADAIPHPAASAIGLNVTHMRDLEGPYDPARGILAQRHYCLFLQAMSKPAFARVPTRWSGGFHASSNVPVFDPGFFLLHLKNFDVEYRLSRQAVSRSWEWSGSFGGHARRPDAEVVKAFDAAEARRRRSLREDFDFTEEIAYLTSLIQRRPHMVVLGKPAEPRAFPVRRIPPEFASLF